jgi:PAS domain S-box-containing protein
MLGFVRQWLDPARRRLATRLQLAMSAGKMAAWEVNLRTRARWWSAEMHALHGLAEGDALPDEYLSIVHPEDRERLREQVEAGREDCGDHQVQYRVLWPDGTYHWLESSGTTLCDDDSRPDLMMGVCVDIDARKEEEHNLQFLAQASAELAALTDYAETMQRIAHLAVPHFADWCAVDMLQRDGSLQRVAVAHVEPEKVHQAHALHERYPPGPADRGGPWHVVRSGKPLLVPVITDEMLVADIPDPGQLEATRSLGLHSYMGVPLVSQGRGLGVMSFITADSRRVFTQRDLVLATDLAARAAVAIRNAELVDALRQSDTAKDVFLATLAHELRNPLSPIANTLALLSRSAEPARLLPQALEVLGRQTTHLTRLVDDLLDLARVNAGKIELRREVLELRDVLRTAIEASQPLIDRRGHTLAIELPGEPVHVDADAVRLAQVFSNLLNNAAKYTPQGGRIELRMTPGEDRVDITVSDSGIGIAPDLLPRVFELFTQASHPLGTEPHGLGIGLYLVRGLVAMHGGTISAASEGLDRGSRFTVCLPRVAARAAERVEDGPHSAGQRKKVLVVDDNRDATETLAMLLQMLGHDTATAHDGASALRTASEFQPDVVLLDIGLPDMNGYEVARRMRAAGANDMRLVALTGWGQAEDKRRAADAGFDTHWTKPVDPSRLDEL